MRGERGRGRGVEGRRNWLDGMDFGAGVGGNGAKSVKVAQAPAAFAEIADAPVQAVVMRRDRTAWDESPLFRGPPLSFGTARAGRPDAESTICRGLSRVTPGRRQGRCLRCGGLSGDGEGFQIMSAEREHRALLNRAAGYVQRGGRRRKDPE